VVVQVTQKLLISCRCSRVETAMSDSCNLAQMDHLLNSSPAL